VSGPEVTTGFLDAYQRLDPWDGRNDDDRAEGGLLVDFDHRVLMMFGIYRGPALRQAHLDPQVYGLA
jgi:hypothetical protein